MKYSSKDNSEFYNDEVLDFGYESEAMAIDSEEYIRFPLPKGKSMSTIIMMLHCLHMISPVGYNEHIKIRYEYFRASFSIRSIESLAQYSSIVVDYEYY
jgi:hypothetical protein